MISKTVKYVDYNGTEREERFLFHYSKAELMEMEMSTEGGFSERVKRIIEAKDRPTLIRVIKDFVLDAYGVKSDDGKRFQKNEEIKTAFKENPAFSDIFMELASNDVAAAEFVRGVIPDDMKDKYDSVTKK